MGTGMCAALAVLAALRERDRTGQGCEITTALFDTAVAWIAYQLLGYLASGEVPVPQGSGAAIIVSYAAFRTADGYLMIAAPTDTLFRWLCHVLERADLADDPGFADNSGRVRHRDALLPAIEATTSGHGTAALLERLHGAGVTCAPIQRLDEVAADPQIKASEMLAPTPHPEIPDFQAIALPLRWNGVRPTPRRPTPRVGEHTDEILEDLGFTGSEIAALRAARIA